jgi:transcriptional activator of cad operon
MANRTVTEPASTNDLRIGEWRVSPGAGEISKNGETTRLELRAMRLLLCLAERADQVVSIDTLLKQVWGDVAVSPDSVYQVVALLRRQLGDDAKDPMYIETVPKLGYRIVAKVGPWSAETQEVNEVSGIPGERSTGEGRSRTKLIVSATALSVVVLGGWLFLWTGRHKQQPGSTAPDSRANVQSVAVLPFLDLTDGMKEEEFADGITEELIDKLSNVPGLRVPSATSSFYFKGKKVPVGEMAKTLGVSYLLDGSVRKAGDQLRIAARLLRADTGYVVWTETYDRPAGDRVLVQDEIAGKVAKALSASLRGGAAQ